MRTEGERAVAKITGQPLFSLHAMLDIAQENDAVAREFNATVQNLVLSGRATFTGTVSRVKADSALTSVTRTR